MDTIVRPPGLTNTVPGTDDSSNFTLSGYNKSLFLKKVAKPYDWKGKELRQVEFKYGFGPAAGIMSSFADLAIYTTAIDEKRFLKPATWDRVFTPFVTATGRTIQYGLAGL